MSGNIFIDPLDLSQWGGTGPTGDPGFTQLVNDTLGTSASDADGFDAVVTDVFATVDALDVATALLDADLDALLALGNNTDPGNLDNSFAGYNAQEPVSGLYVAGFAALAPPALLEMPIAPTFGYGPTAIVAQTTLDLGTLTVGAPALVHELGRYDIHDKELFGLRHADFANTDSDTWGLVKVITFQKPGVEDGKWDLIVTPLTAGQFRCQVNLYGLHPNSITVATFTVTVVP